MRHIVDDHMKQQAIEEARKIYAKIAEDDKLLAEDFLNICSGPVSKYKALERFSK